MKTFLVVTKTTAVSLPYCERRAEGPANGADSHCQEGLDSAAEAVLPLANLSDYLQNIHLFLSHGSSQPSPPSVNHSQLLAASLGNNANDVAEKPS